MNETLPHARAKLEELRGILKCMESVLVAFSGGVDSTFLLKVASDVLGDKVLAVTALSPTYPAEEHDRAVRLAESFGARHVTITTDELGDPDFCRNPPERCYHCKTELFTKLSGMAAEQGIRFVADASNLDDCDDYRPGRRAAAEIGVRSPIVEAGISKHELRELSREMDLPTWDMPSMACLASRFPYGETIDQEKLTRVEHAEKFLRKKGFRQVRVRSHGSLARIEVERERVPELAGTELAREVTDELKGLGFIYVTVDLQGYRTGSLNEELPDGEGNEGPRD